MSLSLSNYYNISRILRLLWLQPGLSRIELSETLEINKSSITKIISWLEQEALVVPVSIGETSPQGGRKKICLALNSRAACTLGLDFSVECVRAEILDLCGSSIWSGQYDTDIKGSKLVETAARISRDLKRVLGASGRLIGVGAAVPGIVDAPNGTVIRSKPLEITEALELGYQLRDIFQVPCFVDNDANCCCYGELLKLRQEDDYNFIYILGQWRKGTVKNAYKGVSIGLGLVARSTVHYGKDYSAGEFRSINWKNENKNQFSLSDKDIAEAPSNRRIFLKMTSELAAHAALLANVFDMNTLYLGGFFDPMDSEVEQIFRSEIEKNQTYPDTQSCQVHFSIHGSRATANGAAALVLDKIFGAGAATSLGQETGAALLLQE